jgi:small subunit ribosomal protein S9
VTDEPNTTPESTPTPPPVEKPATDPMTSEATSPAGISPEAPSVAARVTTLGSASTSASSTSASPTSASPTSASSTSKKARGPKFGYYWGTGRRKSAVARVRIREGTGKFEVNKKPLDKFFCVSRDREDIVMPLKAAECQKRVDVFVNVKGGGTTGQAGAIVLGLARALLNFNHEYERPLRDGEFLSRDSRRVERKKYGRSGARRRFQFSKR